MQSYSAAAGTILRRWGEPARDAAELVRESFRIVVAGEALSVLHYLGPAETSCPQVGGDGRGLPAGERDDEGLLASVAGLLLTLEVRPPSVCHHLATWFLSAARARPRTAALRRAR